MQVYGTSALGGYLSVPWLSEELRVAAQPLMKGRQFTKKITDWTMNKGGTMYYDKVGNIADEGGIIGEDEMVTTSQISFSQSSMTVYEFSSKALEWSHKLETLGQISVEDPIVEALKNDMAKVLNKHTMNAFRGGDFIYTMTGLDASPSYTLATTGTCATTATRPFRVYDLKNVVDLMSGTYNIPFYDGENYVCLCTTAFLRGLTDDRNWIEALHYGRPQDLFTGEVGMMHGVRFVKETHILNNALSGGGGEAIFIGADAVFEAVIEAEEIQARVATDFGRNPALRWAFMGGWARVWDYTTDGEDRLFRVYSS